MPDFIDGTYRCADGDQLTRHVTKELLELLVEAAEIFVASVYTLRAQLRAIKDKTGTSRLAALVRLLGAVAG